MGLRVRWSRQSRDHLLAIRHRIREEHPSAAERMRVRIRDTVERLGLMPQIGHPGRCPGTMEFVVAPYILVYRIMPTELRVLGIFHGARDTWGDFAE